VRIETRVKAGAFGALGINKSDGRRFRRARNIVRRHANATEIKLVRRYQRAKAVLAVALLTGDLS
jgi:hypothetical protein